MSTYQRKIPLNKLYVPGHNTNLCFLGASSDSEASVTVGGDITTNEKVRSWWKKVAMGVQATGAYAGSIIELDYADGFLVSQRWCNNASSKDWSTEEVTGTLTTLNGNLACPDAPPGVISSTADAQALSLFARRIRDAQGSFRGSTVVAELAETIRGLRNPAAGLRGLLDFYHRRSRDNIRKAIGRDPLSRRVQDLTKGQRRAAQRALSESWLEYQYGALPLIGDIRDAIRSYNRFSNRPPRQAVSAISYVDSDISRTTKSTSFHDFSVLHEIFSQDQTSVRYYGAVKLSTNTFSSSLAEEAGFRTRDFLPALWEWIPYSFLVDYFSNIGDIIEAASIVRSDVAWMARTWRNTAYRDGSRSTAIPLTSFSWPTTNTVRLRAFFPMQATWRRRKFGRAAYFGTLVPHFQLEIPGSKNFKKYLNIAALLSLRGMRR